MAICPNCGNQTGEGAVFCDQCGTRLPEPEAVAPAAVTATPTTPEAVPAGGSAICPACGAGNVPGEAFCDYCGSPLEAPAPVAAPEEALTAAEEAPAEEVAAEVEAPAEAQAVAPAGEEAVAEKVAPAEEEALTCLACGAAILPGEAFCSNCGASLAAAPIPPEPAAEVEAEVEAAPEEEAAAPETAAPVAPPPAPAAEAAPAPVPPAPAGSNCPACGAEIAPEDAFCSACGFALQAPAAAPAAAAPAPAAGPRLVVSASSAEIPLQAGDEFLVGREDPVSGIYPEVDLTPHGGEEGGVSRRHARIIVENGEYYVEDLDSTNFTFVNKQKLAPKTRQRIADGDEIRFGRVTIVFRT